jgi:hypothetical protein
MSQGCMEDTVKRYMEMDQEEWSWNGEEGFKAC